MEKSNVTRRVDQMIAEGTVFKTGVNVGVDVTGDELRAQYDAVVLAGGATAWRDLNVPGRESKGIYQAMEYLPQANQVAEGVLPAPLISAEGKHVVVIGGGDTGADCIGTALRQGAASVTQLEIMPRPPELRPDHQPWPTFPILYKMESAHEELAALEGPRVYAANTLGFVADEDGNVKALRLVDVEGPQTGFKPIEGTEREIPAELVTLSMGFLGPQKAGLLEQLDVELDGRGNVVRNLDYRTSVDNVFVAGDMGRGQSLIVWAIAEGRAAASRVDQALQGSTNLPYPIPPTARPLV